MLNWVILKVEVGVKQLTLDIKENTFENVYSSNTHTDRVKRSRQSVFIKHRTSQEHQQKIRNRKTDY